MLKNLFKWIKSNILSTILIIILGIILFDKKTSRNYVKSSVGYPQLDTYGGLANTSEAKYADTESYDRPVPSTPTTSSARMMITNSNVSLHVKDVEDSLNEIKKAVEDKKGYVIEYQHNQGNKDQSATVRVRVPAESLEYLLGFFKKLAINVVSENVSGSDITDQYSDISRKLTRLESTMARLEAINLENQDVDEIIRVLRQQDNLQNQIDSLRGQKDAMEKKSQTVLLTINLATDEQALPYLPSEPWSPEAVFKKAFRSMIKTTRGIVNLAIWAFTYSPILLALGIVYTIIDRIANKRREEKQN